MYRVWLDHERKIASFHEEPCCEMREFLEKELFLDFLLELCRGQFRFQ